MLAFEDVAINEHFFDEKIAQAFDIRKRFMPSETNAYRLIHSEGDFLSGLIVDVYGEFLVAEFNTAGIDAWKSVIIQCLQKYFPAHSIFERSDSDLRKWEGLKRSVGVLAGNEPPDAIEIREHGLLFGVDVKGGQKTGFFLDQRENRAMVRSLSSGKRVLNCFAYTGGFSVYAAKGGAKEVVSVESSEPAVAMGRKNFERNGFMPSPQPSPSGRGEGEGIFRWAQQDVFDYLRATKKEFDLIILDPPAFCKSKNQVQDAARGYKDINLQALRQLPKGGLLFTFSCSSYITPDLFQKILFGAAADAKRDVRILQKTSHAIDHPINIYHPEGEYLKGLLCEVI
jgi:23S rRNA (cytosine1962-C5)-methyltransferase